MKEIKSRLKKARLEAGYTQQRLADKMNLSRQLISFWENPTRPEIPSLEQLHLYSSISGTSVVQLINGTDESVSNISVVRNEVPLLEWIHAGLRELPLFTDDQEVVTLPCPIEHSEHTYALTVSGRSMTSNNPLEKSFSDGSIIYCDPALVQNAISGSFIIAYLPSSNEMIFKRYGKDGPNTWLESLNSEYARITEPFEIRALVIGAFQPV